MTNAAIGALLAAVVAIVAYRARALTLGGAIAAFVVGGVVFGFGGWHAALALLAFFIPSTLLSRLGRRDQSEPAAGEKAGPRDAWQVLANGGVAALCAILALRWGGVPAAALAGSLAAASADTWGTEIGTRSRQVPRSIVTLRPVAAGLSGGVTAWGTLATLGGAVCVAAVAALAGVASFWPVVVGGFAGATIDSLLGATAQALRWCPRCTQACETNPHECGTATVLRRGFTWCQNDAVNFAATLAGAAIAAALAAFVWKTG